MWLAVPWAWGGSQVPIVLQLTLDTVGLGLDPLSDANRTAIKDGMDQILSGTGRSSALLFAHDSSPYWRLSLKHQVAVRGSCICILLSTDDPGPRVLTLSTVAGMHQFYLCCLCLFCLVNQVTGSGGAGVSFDVPLAGIQQQGPAVIVPYVPVNINPPVQGVVPPQVPRVTATVEVHTVQDSVAKIMSTIPLLSLELMLPYFPFFLHFCFIFRPVLPAPACSALPSSFAVLPASSSCQST